MFEVAAPGTGVKNILISGPSGAGKTHTALLMAAALEAGEIAVIDVGERQSSAGYAPAVPHRLGVCAYSQHNASIKDFLALLEHAQLEHGIVIIDSLSEVWLSVLAYKESLDANPRSNSFANWGKAGKIWDKVLHTIQTTPVPIIALARSKMAYEIKRAGDTTSVVGLGLGPILREGTEYAFDYVFTMERGHITCIQPRHNALLRDFCEHHPTVEQLRGVWL